MAWYGARETAEMDKGALIGAGNGIVDICGPLWHTEFAAGSFAVCAHIVTPRSFRGRKAQFRPTVVSVWADRQFGPRTWPGSTAEGYHNGMGKSKPGTQVWMGKAACLYLVRSTMRKKARLYYKLKSINK